MRCLRGVFAWMVCWLVGMGVAWGDPCGMVPPIYTGPGNPITRVGPQKTYVFYKDGVESIVLRPSFSGKVSHFGMLIPFPSAPEIRKMPDNIFSHIGAAIDPPEVRVWVYRHRYKRRGWGYRGKRSVGSMATKSAPARDSVRVVRQEAVGMYQVAVLEAGSPASLKRWMKKNGYIYPSGMDKVVGEYVRARWFFVAVKTRVAGKQGVSPRPGMRKARAGFPQGGSFRGAVQAMGFRFRTRKLVVPMRLSAFNKGRLRNVVYLLTDGPRQIRHIDPQFVRRQLSGDLLYRNVTQPLPLRVYGGKPSQIEAYRWQYIQRRRDPERHNGLAKELFASDLLAVRLKKLALPHEEQKKVLLRISERLLLRGMTIDALHRGSLHKARMSTVARALRDLKRMTMTVVDGDFPREILARDNLSFRTYRMAAAKNTPRLYNARVLGAAYVGGGILTRWLGPKKTHQWLKPSLRPAPPVRRAPRRVSAKRQIARLLRQLRNPKRVNQAVARLVRMGTKAVPYLWAEVIEDQPLIPRGWAIVALADMGSARIGGRLATIHSDAKYPMLLRTWAAAGRINIAQSMGELKALIGLTGQFPATIRPLTKQLTRLLRKTKAPPLEDLLLLSTRYYQLRRHLVPTILAAGARPLLRIMQTHSDNQIRRQAAAYLGNLGLQKPDPVAKMVVRSLRFRPRANAVPWDGGALFIPSIRWSQPYAKALVGHLIAWYLWCEGKGLRAQQRQIHNNIRSLTLARIVGYRSPGWSPATVDRWLAIWGGVVGCQGITALLKQQGVLAIRRYQSVLGQLNCP